MDVVLEQELRQARDGARRAAKEATAAAEILDAMLRAAVPPPPAAVPPPPAPTVLDPDKVARPIAWGRSVSSTFVARAWWTAAMLRADPDDLMACMCFETGGTFSASVRNGAGSGATGLIQFMPATARGMNTTVEALAAMTAEDQLRYVYRYLRPYAGRLDTTADFYMAILYPKMVGQTLAAAMPWPRGSKLYTQNAGLDRNRDGIVTKAEAAYRVLELLAEGRKPGNAGYGR